MQWHEKVNNDDLKKQREINNHLDSSDVEALDDKLLAMEDQTIIADGTNQIVLEIENTNPSKFEIEDTSQLELKLEDIDQQRIQNICNDPNVDVYSEIQLNYNSNEQLYENNVLEDNIFYAAVDNTTNSDLINNKLHSEESSNELPTEVNYAERVKALYIQWLELLLHDQSALSQLLHAEAIHIQAFLSEESHFSTHPTRQDIVAFQETVGKVIDSLNEKQRIHIKLLDSSIKLFQQGERVE
ncbi:hypothetical protein [Paenibacillus endoradicis]|uniref:hypothetical protein n=1 Tax=Paenibacillus endoradicis TaxID=2972487 RepID=UPI0021599502|nr:hypothetical protein [Paenibacillus endoradicis]MCR8656727.1 hypothetical protein [Paenibacillus endoradicis]